MSSNSRAAALLAAFVAAGCAASGRADPPVDLAALQVVPQRGQTADQARRDRYECHNWAIEQSGEVPPPAASNEDVRRDSEREKNAERADRAIAGAAIGAAIGGILRGTRDRNPAGGVLAGAAVGAAVGAATQGHDSQGKDAAAAPPQPSDYLRALSACLEGRGYSLTMPAAPTKDHG